LAPFALSCFEVESQELVLELYFCDCPVEEL
jgi:hypothetical protein